MGRIAKVTVIWLRWKARWPSRVFTDRKLDTTASLWLIFKILYIFLKEWKYGDGKKNRVRDYCRFWLYYTQNMKKSRFPKSVCAVSYTHLDVYKRQPQPIFTKNNRSWELYNSGLYAKNYLILFELAAVIVCHRKKIYTQTDTQTHRQTDRHTHRHFSESDFSSCFEGSTIRIRPYLEHDFFVITILPFP